MADHFAIVASAKLQFLHFALQPRRFERPSDDMNEPVGLERLLDEVVGALLDRGDRGFDSAVSGDHHDGNVGVLALDRVEHLDAIETAALQPDVQHDKLRAPLANGSKHAVAIAGDTGVVTFVAQDPGNEIANVFLVVYDKDFSCYVRAVLAHPLHLSVWCFFA